jgi:hypothetical protein
MYKVIVQKSKDAVTVIKAERDIFRRLLVVRDSGRDVDLPQEFCDMSFLLSHPLALAGTDKKLQSATKSDLADIP